MFAPDMVVSQQPGFLDTILYYFFHSGTKWDFPEGDRCPASGQISFYLKTDLFRRETHFFDDHQGYAV